MAADLALGTPANSYPVKSWVAPSGRIYAIGDVVRLVAPPRAFSDAVIAGFRAPDTELQDWRVQLLAPHVFAASVPGGMPLVDCFTLSMACERMDTRYTVVATGRTHDA